MNKKSKNKLKQIKIEIQIRDLIDLVNVFHQLKQQINDGNQFGEFHHETSSIQFNMEFLEKTPYIEKQIGDDWFMIMQPKNESDL